VPKLFDPAHPIEQATGAMTDTSPARFRTFDAIRHFFHQATQQVPITLCGRPALGDVPSLSLLEFLSQELLGSPTAHRRHVSRCRRLEKDSVLTRSVPWAATPIFGACIFPGFPRVPSAKSPSDCGGRQLVESAIKIIYQQTDGNPLFAIELINGFDRLKAPAAAISTVSARIPAGVRETIGRRLSRLSTGATNCCVSRRFMAGISEPVKSPPP